MPKLFIVSLGCPKNLSDAEVMAGELAAAGWQLTPDEEGADAALINTCAFLSSAVEESESEIRRLLALKARGKLSKVMVTGCLVEREKEKLAARFPGLDALVGIHALAKAAAAIEQGRNYILPAEGPLSSPRLKARLTAPHSAYLKVADGCDNRCAYCLIPSIRGPFRSKPVEELAEEARKLAESGAVEISLIAQDTTAYGTDLYGRPRLAWLLNTLLQIKSVKWWRLMYVYPERLHKEVIEVMRANKSIVRYLDMPLQHVSDRVLKRMNRVSSEKSIKTKIAELRRIMPDIAIRTNFIVGFPGETQEDFSRLLAFVKKTRFDNVGVFKYSREPGTPAAGFPGQVPEDVKEERAQALIAAQSAVVDVINSGLKGKKTEVLMDSPVFGRTYRDAPEIDGRVEVQVQPGQKKPKAGDLVKVKINSATGYLRRATAE
ncbi:MAG: ribosomal protein S12 methylthiotransferase RimO [Elusimicrobia bacterium GWC2_61_19]|nr:MAG: ribosomal protein S12 methylthiotransferase RimO [Elusimicrobia bacterium GWC2_61_19]